MEQSLLVGHALGESFMLISTLDFENGDNFKVIVVLTHLILNVRVLRGALVQRLNVTPEGPVLHIQL